MDDEPNRFAALMERMAQGDNQAAGELFDKYRKAVIRVIRYRLNQSPQLRMLFDSTDFLQEVWQDIIAHPAKISEFAERERFLKYLAGIACHKIEKAQRKYLGAKKRDLRQQHHLGATGIAAAAATVIDPRPGPVEQTASSEAWQRWLLSLTPTQRQIVLMRRDGFTYQEIAAELGCAERSIRRMVAEFRDMLPPDL